MSFDSKAFVATVACAAVLLIAGCNNQSAPAPQAETYSMHQRHIEVQVTRAVQQSIAVEQEFTGDLLPRRVTRIVAEVSGVVTHIPQVGQEINVTVGGKTYSERLGLLYGQHVSKGDLLVQIDPRDYEVAVQIAEAKLSKSQADLDKLLSWERAEEVSRLVAMRAEAVARLEQAKRNRDRLRELLPSRSISQSEFEEAETAVTTAAAAVDSATATVEQAQAGPTAEAIAVQRALVAEATAEVEQKKIELSKTTILAPYDGVVTSINVEVGERVAPGGDSLIEMMDLRYLIAEINVPEAYVGAVEVENIAQVLAAGSNEPVPGIVVAVNEMVDPATRTFRTRVAIDNIQAKFKAGQFAKVRIPIRSTTSDSVVVPARSMVFIEGQPHVYVLEDERAVARRVKPGLTTEQSVEITSGLAAGEQVITDDPHLLTDGVQVTVHSAPGQLTLTSAQK